MDVRVDHHQHQIVDRRIADGPRQRSLDRRVRGLEFGMRFGRQVAEGRRIRFRCEYQRAERRSEEHTSELQSLVRISYAVFCLKKKKRNTIQNTSLAYTHTYIA